MDRDSRYLLHHRDAKHSIAFRSIIETARVKTLALLARSPNLMLARNGGSDRPRRSVWRRSFLRRTHFTSGGARVCYAPPQRTEPSTKVERLAGPPDHGTRRGGAYAMSRAARRAPALLPSGRRLNWRGRSADDHEAAIRRLSYGCIRARHTGTLDGQSGGRCGAGDEGKSRGFYRKTL